MDGQLRIGQVERLVAVAELGAGDGLADLLVDALRVLQRLHPHHRRAHAAVAIGRADALRVPHVALVGSVDDLDDVCDERVVPAGHRVGGDKVPFARPLSARQSAGAWPTARRVLPPHRLSPQGGHPATAASTCPARTGSGTPGARERGVAGCAATPRRHWSGRPESNRRRPAWEAGCAALCREAV